MRKTLAVCLFVIFCGVSGIGQTQPQWTVIYSLVVFGQTAQIQHTTAFIPTEQGLYRLSFCASGNPQSTQGFEVDWVTADGLPAKVGAGIAVGGQGTYLFTPKVGTPVSYSVYGSQYGFKGVYNVAFTVEQLQASN